MMMICPTWQTLVAVKMSLWCLEEFNIQIQCELHKWNSRARRQIADSDDEEQSVDQPVQTKAVRKLVLDKEKQATAKEIDAAATESEESEDKEDTPSRPSRFRESHGEL
jgi:hypothetical protein